MANEERKQKIDWKKKGLGWIPDYPDLRDYKLNDDKKEVVKNSRLKKEESTDAIEDLVEEFLKTLKFFSQGKSPRLDSLKAQVEKLENRFFGNIEFRTVKVYKLLRKVSEVQSFCLDKALYESELSRQIIELKNYLSVLVLKDSSLKPLDESPAAKPRSKLAREIFSKPAEIAKWLREKKFDDPTEELVMLFQCCSNIEVDGLVGLETYTTLNEYFSGSKNPEELKSKQRECAMRCSNILDGKLDSNGLDYDPKIRLLSIPSLIPTKIFKEIFQELRKSTFKQTDQHMQKNAFFLNDVFETQFLNDIYVGNSEIFKHLFNPVELTKLEESLVNSDLNDEREAQTIKKINETMIDDSLNLCGLNIENIDNFIKIFYNEFSLIEPIVTIVLKISSPLACFKNQSLGKIIDLALVIAKKFFSKAYEMDTTMNTINGGKVTTLEEELTALEKLEELKDLEFLSHQALDKVLQKFRDIKWVIKDNDALSGKNLYQEIKIFPASIEELATNLKQEQNAVKRSDLRRQLEELEKQKCEYETFARTLWFFLMVKKFLNQFYIDRIQQVDLIRSRKPNLFDKQDLFEIDLCDEETHQVSSDDQAANSEIFSIPRLQIPFSRDIIKAFEEQKELDTKGRKPYLFLPGIVDLSFWCPEIEDQQSLNSCAAFAGVALIEYFANRSFGKHTDVSPLFLYKAARNLMNLEGDVGASLRETMKALALFGVPPEEAWSYQENKVDEEPPAFCYSYAQSYQALKYFRLDYAGISREILLFQIKAVLAAGFPCMFGFTIYTSAYEENNVEKGIIPFPNPDSDRVVGGHAAVVVGYDDYRLIPCANCLDSSRGAFLIRNSWGVEWGQQGYGWLSYDYVLAGLTSDWWSLLKSEWFDKDSFGLGASNEGCGWPKCR